MQKNFSKMGRADTGLSNNSPNNDDVSPNTELEHPVPEETSDSDPEESGEDRLGYYMPLSQNPIDGEPFYESNNESDDDNFSEDIEIADGATAISVSPIPDVPSVETLVTEVWAKPPPKEVDIELTDNKIDLVKQVMLNVKLPSEAVPDWAKNIPEEEWKSHLLAKLSNDLHK